MDEEVDELIAWLEERPDLIGRPIEQDPTVRRVYLKRTRYYVYFRIVDDGNRVEVLALWHGSRNDLPEL
jgi:plasmid stabilization system protein ParE